MRELAYRPREQADVFNNTSMTLVGIQRGQALLQCTLSCLSPLSLRAKNSQANRGIVVKHKMLSPVFI